MRSDFGKFIFRTPRLPFNELYNNEGDEVEFLMSFFLREDFQAAIYVASTDFFVEMLKFMDDHNKLDRKYNDFKTSAIKYISRICTRATPFGLFSGAGIGDIRNINEIIPKEKDAFNAKVRLDMGLLGILVDEFLSNSVNHRTLTLYSNNTIYKIGSQYRYVECSSVAGVRSYMLGTFEHNSIIALILKKARLGITYNELTIHLVNQGYGFEESQSFISEMIFSSILISDLEPQIVGIEYEEQLRQFICDKINLIEQYPDLQPIRDILLLSQKFKKFEITDIKSVKQNVRDLTKIEGKINDFQIDASIMSKTASLDEEFLSEIGEASTIFFKFCTARENPNLKSFIKKFNERYEDSWIPISEVVDLEMGIGYGARNKEFMIPSPFIDDIPLNGFYDDNKSVSLEWSTTKHNYLLQKIIDAKRENLDFIEITNEEVREFDTNENLLPPTYNLFLDLYKEEKGADFYVFGQVGASSAACIINRFSYLDNDIHDLVQGITDFEQSYYDNCIIAEINHITDYRLGNITQRPDNRKFNLSYYSGSNKISDGNLSFDDLLITVRGQQVIIFSKKYKKRVIPRLSNAHNYNKDALPGYQLLCDLQDTVTPAYMNLVLDLSPFHLMFNFIPRIKYKKAILSLATWFIDSSIFKKHLQKPEDLAHEEVIMELKERKIPYRIFVLDKGVDLYLDLRKPYFFRVFKKVILTTSRLTIKEFPGYENFNSVVKNKDGSFMNEVIIPMKNFKAPKPSFNVPNHVIKNITKEFSVGKGWIYYKLYGGIKTSKKIIYQDLYMVLSRLEKLDYINKWFYLTYKYTDYHIRIRVQVSCPQHENVVIEELNNFVSSLHKNRLVYNSEISTYIRELDRYLYDKIEFAESIFHLDSINAIKLLKLLDKNNIRNFEWLVGLALVDSYLESFGYNIENKYRFVLRMRDRFAKEFQSNKVQRRLFVKKYRSNMMIINEFFSNMRISNNDIKPVFGQLDSFKMDLLQIKKKHYSNLSEDLLEEQLISFIHMSILRFFMHKNRLYEYAIYSILEQHYRYVIGRNKYLENE